MDALLVSQNFPGVFLRCVGLLTVLPLGQMLLIPRIALAAAAAFFFVDSVPSHLPLNAAHLAGEFGVGVILGLPAALMVECAGMWGELYDTARGQAIASSYDHLQNTPSSQFQSLACSWAWAALLSLGLLPALFLGFGKSLSLLPLGEVIRMDYANLGQRILQGVALQGGALLASFLPIGLVFVGIDFALGLISKFVPGLSLQNEAFAIKTITGLLLITAALRFDLINLLNQAALPKLVWFGG
jgi:flagellar biosynthesis protein FliR